MNDTQELLMETHISFLTPTQDILMFTELYGYHQDVRVSYVYRMTKKNKLKPLFCDLK